MLSDGKKLSTVNKTVDEDVVEYSISKNMSQTMISEYKLKLIDKKLLETKLKEMENLIDNNDK